MACRRPKKIGLADVEPVTFETIDGLSLSGWFFAASGPSPPVTVLVFNGNAGNRWHRCPLAAALQRHGFQVLLVDYRDYGGNPGAPSKNGLAADGRATRVYLAGRSDVDLSRLAYFGESLGTAVAVDLAVEHPPAALVLRSPFTSMADLGRYHYPFVPVGPVQSCKCRCSTPRRTYSSVGTISCRRSIGTAAKYAVWSDTTIAQIAVDISLRTLIA